MQRFFLEKTHLIRESTLGRSVPTERKIWTHTDTKKKPNPLGYQTLKHAHMGPIKIPHTFPYLIHSNGYCNFQSGPILVGTNVLTIIAWDTNAFGNIRKLDKCFWRYFDMNISHFSLSYYMYSEYNNVPELIRRRVNSPNADYGLNHTHFGIHRGIMMHRSLRSMTVIVYKYSHFPNKDISFSLFL